MAQWVKVLATQPDHISSFSGTDLVRGENQFPYIALLLLVCHGARAGVHTCKKISRCTHMQKNVKYLKYKME